MTTAVLNAVLKTLTDTAMTVDIPTIRDACDSMIVCGVCGDKIDEDDVFYECPYCGRDINNDGLWKCENCDSTVDWAGDEWLCPYCGNTGISDDDNFEEGETCPECGSDDYDGYCYECGYPNNQGWIGENY